MNKKMKKIIIIISSVIILVIAAIPVSKVLYSRGLENKVLNSYFSMPKDYTVSAKLESESGNYILQDIEKEFESGIDSLVTDVCFNKNNVPYVCLNSSLINDKSLPLEDVFKLFGENPLYENKKISLNISDASDISEIDILAEKYKISDKILLTGININQAPYIKKQSKIPFYLDYEIDKSKTDDEEYLNKVITDIVTSGAVGINCKADDFTEKLNQMFSENWLKKSFNSLNGKNDVCKALLLYPDNIVTDEKEYTLELIDKWKNEAPIEYYGVRTTE